MSRLCGFYLNYAARISNDRPQPEDDNRVPTYANRVYGGIRSRHERLLTAFAHYPAMAVSYNQFQSNISRYETILRRQSNWFNNNRNGEAAKFMSKFSFDNWRKLSSPQKRKHTSLDCRLCDDDDIRNLLRYGKRNKSDPEHQENPTEIAHSVVNDITKLIHTDPACNY